MKHRYCPQCGAALSARVLGDEGHVPYCEGCKTPFFELPRPCVLVLCVNDRNEAVLLRQPDVSETHWVLVAGFCKTGETAEDTVAREVCEETGLTVCSAQFVASYARADRELLMLGFLARVEGILSDQSVEVEDVRWFPLDEVPRLLRPGSTGLAHFRKASQLMAG